MHRIDGPGHVGNQFTSGDPSIGQQATMVTADWLNDMQGNMARAIEQAGIVLAKGNFDQLYAAIVAIAAGAVGDGSGAVPTTRQLIGAGLVQVIGDLAVDRTINVKKSTAASVAAMVADDEAITPLALAGGIGGRLLAGVGFNTLLGMKEVWGTFTVGANSSANITFPDAFPTMCVHADCSGGRLDYGAQDNNPFVSGRSAGGCTIFNCADAPVSGTYWARGF